MASSLLALSLRRGIGFSSKATTVTTTVAIAVETAHRSLSTLNINHALKKAEEGDSFRDLALQPVMTLQGIGPKHLQGLESLNLKTIQQLADYKFFHLARSVTVLSKTEQVNGRSEDSKMNIRKGIDKEFQSLPLSDLIEMPVHVFKELAPVTGGKAFQSLGINTVADLAEFKYCRWAEAIVGAAKFEEEDK